VVVAVVVEDVDAVVTEFVAVDGWIECTRTTLRLYGYGGYTIEMDLGTVSDDMGEWATRR
jgi:hypothetical protein